MTTKKQIDKPTQEKRILEVLKNCQGEWVCGQKFCREMMITQFHARIWSLQKKGVKIVVSPFSDKFGFKSYMLVPDGQQKLL